MNWKNIIWNNKEIRIDKKPVYYKNYLESEIIYIHDLLFDLNINDSFGYVSNKLAKLIFYNGQAPEFLKGNHDHIANSPIPS